MACQIINDKKLGKIHICGAHEELKEPPICRKCSAMADKLCDYPVGHEKTCDVPLCGEHVVNITGDIDYCPEHAKGYFEWLEAKQKVIKAKKLGKI